MLQVWRLVELTANDRLSFRGLYKVDDRYALRCIDFTSNIKLTHRLPNAFGDVDTILARGCAWARNEHWDSYFCADWIRILRVRLANANLILKWDTSLPVQFSLLIWTVDPVSSLSYLLWVIRDARVGALSQEAPTIFLWLFARTICWGSVFAWLRS